MDIVIIVAKITVEKTPVSSTPAVTPIAPIINENSDNCAREIDVKKLVRGWYPVTLSSIKVIMGFKINAPINKNPNNNKFSPTPLNTTCIHNATKKRMAKKSRIGEILDSSSSLNCELARLTPAINAPIAIESSRV